ncbi:MAG: helix-turn-helix domain-containing protein [Clostridia bacterium]|nr:helix-turn-helix domain-containing protein [Clostridia bacterium]
MSVFRVEKSREFTVIANCVFKDKSLSAKAKGLLVEMLSLPESWDYTLKGLTYLFSDGLDSIRQGIRELEEHGYIVRERKRDEKGRLGGMEYVIYETPRKPVEKPETPVETPVPETDTETSEPASDMPVFALPTLDSPTTENPTLDEPAQEKPTTYKEIKNQELNKSITHKSRTNSFIPSEADKPEEPAGTEVWKERRNDGSDEREKIKRQIEYDIMCSRYNPVQLDELVEVMLEVRMNLSPTTRFSKDEVYATEFVQQKYAMLTAEHIGLVLDGIRENTTRVLHTKAYLMKCLFNALDILENQITMQVNHDLHGNPSYGELPPFLKEDV